MKNRRITGFYFVFVLFSFVVLGNAQERIRFDFSGATAKENNVTIMGAGFGTYSLADVFFKDIATDNAFEDATDGHGVLIGADGGETVMIIGPQLDMPYAAMIRCSVRTNKPHVAVTLATIDQGPNVFISTNSPNNGGFFLNQYKRLCTFCVPPSTGFQPLIQVVNTSEAESVLISIDNLDIYPILPDRYYHGDFLNGDENDPSLISISSEDIKVGETPTPEARSTSVPTVIPSPTKAPTDTPIPEPTIIIPPVIDIPGLQANAKKLELVQIGCNIGMGKYEITQAQWEAVMGSNPSQFRGANHPVNRISPDDADKFVSALNAMRLVDDTCKFRLPTESEWENACSWSGESIEDYAWYNLNSRGITHEVGQKKPNQNNLYDMLGNVSEITSTLYSSSNCVLRGGSFLSNSTFCTCSQRDSVSNRTKNPYSGLRILLDINRNENLLPTVTPNNTIHPEPTFTPILIPTLTFTPKPPNTPTPTSTPDIYQQYIGLWAGEMNEQNSLESDDVTFLCRIFNIEQNNNELIAYHVLTNSKYNVNVNENSCEATSFDGKQFLSGEKKDAVILGTYTNNEGEDDQDNYSFIFHKITHPSNNYDGVWIIDSQNMYKSSGGILAKGKMFLSFEKVLTSGNLSSFIMKDLITNKVYNAYIAGNYGEGESGDDNFSIKFLSNEYFEGVISWENGSTYGWGKANGKKYQPGTNVNISGNWTLSLNGLDGNDEGEYFTVPGVNVNSVGNNLDMRLPDGTNYYGLMYADSFVITGFDSDRDEWNIFGTVSGNTISGYAIQERQNWWTYYSMNGWR